METDQKKIFAKNLNQLLAKTNKTQKEVADAIDVSPQTFNTWCQGIALPRMGKVQKLSDYFNVSKSELLDEKVDSSYQKTVGFKINVLGSVAAGIPFEAVENIVDTEEISEDLAKTGTFFGLKIKGDSMEPRICNGDVVIVKQQDDAESGDIVIAMVNSDEATCKRLTKYAGGIGLISLNSKYEPMMFSEDDVLNKPVKILGKVIELRGKL